MKLNFIKETITTVNNLCLRNNYNGNDCHKRINTVSKELFEEYPYEILDDVSRCFYDIDYKLSKEDEYETKKTELDDWFSAMKYLSRDTEKEFVFTTCHRYDEDCFKISYHIIFKNIYINRLKFKEDGMYEELYTWLLGDYFDVLKEHIDDSVYTRTRKLKLPYGKDDNKPRIHLPYDFQTIELSNYTVSFKYLLPENQEYMVYTWGEPTARSDKPEIKEIKEIKQNKANDTERQKNMKDMLEMVDKKRFKSYSEWFILLCLMKANGLDFDDFVRYSLQSGYDKFDKDDCMKKWVELKERDDNAGFKTIHKWLDEDKIDWKSQFCKNSIVHKLLKAYNTDGCLNEKTVSQLFYDEKKDDIYYTNIGWIVYSNSLSGHSWKIVKEDDDIVLIFMKAMSDKMTSYINAEMRKNKEDKDKLKQTSCLQKAMNCLSTFGFSMKCIKTAKCLFRNDKILEEFDQKPYWFSFTDQKAIDMVSGEVVDIKKEHKIVQTCGKNYKQRNDDDIKRALDIIKTIQPDEMIESYLSMLSCSFAGKNINQRIFIHTGKGSNGKSLMGKFLQKALGEYAGLMPIEQLTQNSSGRDQANTSLACMRGKRYVQCNEPEDSKETTLKIARIKELTGDDFIMVRSLFEKASPMPINFTLNVLCNDIPKLSKMDGGIQRRIVCNAYNTRFCDEPKEAYEKLIDYSLEEKIISDDNLQFGLLYLCLDTWKKHKGKYISNETIKKDTNEFIDSNNPLIDFMNDYEESDDFKRSKVLFSEFSSYCISMKIPTLTNKKFNEFLFKLKDIKIVKDDSNGHKIYVKATMNGVLL